MDFVYLCDTIIQQLLKVYFRSADKLYILLFYLISEIFYVNILGLSTLK